MARRERSGLCVLATTASLALATSGCWLTLGLDDKAYTLEDDGTVHPPSGCGDGAPPPMPIISRHVPAFGSDVMPSFANDVDYSSQFDTFVLPGWLAYDLSGVDAGARGRVAVVFYNGTGPYDPVVSDNPGRYGNLAAYRIEGSNAPGGALPDDSTWEVLATVENNTRHSRQHVLDFAGFNWIRIYITAVDDISEVARASLNFDVHDAGAGSCDDWILFGDHMTQEGLHIDGDDTIASRIAAAHPDRFPLIENGGIDFWSAEAARTQILGGWLAEFPGHYVGLAFGWEDASLGTNPLSFYAYEKDLIAAVLAAGKIPVVPKIPWSPDATQQEGAAAMNQQIDALYMEFPEVVPGPDLWTLFADHPEYLTGDGMVVTEQGHAELQRVWAEALLQGVYAQ